jgi:hypothetical protein
MTSKIVVNNIEADAGVSTVTFNSNVQRGSSNLHSTGLNVNDTFVHSTGIALGAGSTIGAVTGVTTYYGDGSQLTGISVDSTKIETGNTSVETSDTGSDGLVKVLVDGSEKVRINNNGQIGINTTSPNTFIHVGSATTNAHYIRLEAHMSGAQHRSLNIFGPDTANTTAPFTFQTGNGYLFKCDAEHSFEIDANRIVKVNNGFGSLAPIYGVRAWVQGNSGTTNGSGGLSSMSRISTGAYQLNFATTMPDDNYAVGCLANNNYDDTSWFNNSETTHVRVYFYTGSSYVDPSEWAAWVIR